MMGSANYTRVGVYLINIFYSPNVSLEFMSQTDRPNCKNVGPPIGVMIPKAV